MLNAVKSEDFLIEPMGKNEFEKNSKDQKEENWKKKGLHEKFSSSVADTSDAMSWLWIALGFVKKNGETMMTAAQYNAL